MEVSANVRRTEPTPRPEQAARHTAPRRGLGPLLPSRSRPLPRPPIRHAPASPAPRDLLPLAWPMLRPVPSTSLVQPAREWRDAVYLRALPRQRPRHAESASGRLPRGPMLAVSRPRRLRRAESASTPRLQRNFDSFRVTALRFRQPFRAVGYTRRAKLAASDAAKMNPLQHPVQRAPLPGGDTSRVVMSKSSGASTRESSTGNQILPIILLPLRASAFIGRK